MKYLCHICVIYDMCHISTVIYHICVICDSWNIGLPVLFLTVDTVIYDSVSYMTYQYHIWSYIRIYFALSVSCITLCHIWSTVVIYDNIFEYITRCLTSGGSSAQSIFPCRVQWCHPTAFFSCARPIVGASDLSVGFVPVLLAQPCDCASSWDEKTAESLLALQAC